MKKPDKWNRNGTFTVAKGKQVVGDLMLKGRNTSLTLYAEKRADLFDLPKDCIQGTMYDLKKVSLFNCIEVSSSENSSITGDRHASVHLLPQFVVYGEQHLTPDAKNVFAIDFLVDDATTLCYDFDAFGHAIDAKPFIAAIVKANATRAGREIPIGDDPAIAYFTGKDEVFAVDTALGKFSAAHRRTENFGGPAGVWIRNNVYLSLEFPGGSTLADAISAMVAALHYVALLVGRPQNLQTLRIWTTKPGVESPAMLHVHWPLQPRRKRSEDGERAGPAEVLLSPVLNEDTFASVTKRWFERQADWHLARLRFFDSFKKQNNYDIDRLIRSANMFDILPASGVPSNVPLSTELASAKKEARKLFRALPQSAERDSVLGELGRLGKSKLKHKVRHRAQSVVDVVGDRFPDLLAVLNEAVDARNYFVHGGDKPRFDYAEHSDVLWFLSDTLEFVFACSDLLEAGWDAVGWHKTPTSMSHPFGRYRVTYAEHLERLKRALGSGL
jgi:hypothetical protein